MGNVAARLPVAWASVRVRRAERRLTHGLRRTRLAHLLLVGSIAVVMSACADTTPTPAPSAPITPSPVTTASPTATPTPSTPTRRDVVATAFIDGRPDNEVRIRIIDEGRRLTDAQAATQLQLNLNLGALFTNQIAIVSLDKEGRSILVLWDGLGCDESATLTVTPAGDAVTVSPDLIGNCDLVGSSRGVVLTFAEAPLRLNLETTPLVEPS